MKRIHNCKGSTLIEVIISMIIVAITAMGGIALYFNSAELKSMTVHKKQAIELANSKMEEFRDMGYSASELNAGFCPTGTVETASDVCLGGEFVSGNCVGGIFCDKNVGLGQVVSVCEVSGYKKIQVDIDWEEVGQIDRQFNVSLITFKRP